MSSQTIREKRDGYEEREKLQDERVDKVSPRIWISLHLYSSVYSVPESNKRKLRSKGHLNATRLQRKERYDYAIASSILSS